MADVSWELAANGDQARRLTLSNFKGNILPGDRILAIAQPDALAAYSDLSHYQICLALEDDGWNVDYELKDAKLKGGGPHYVIHAVTGAIISKRYEQ